eukprot:12471041-Ditylum_brightwellii.AAC.1
MGEDDGAALMVGEDECVFDGVFEEITEGMADGIPEGFVFGEVVCSNVGDAMGFRVDGNAVGYVDGDAILLEGSDGAIRV